MNLEEKSLNRFLISKVGQGYAAAVAGALGRCLSLLTELPLEVWVRSAASVKVNAIA